MFLGAAAVLASTILSLGAPAANAATHAPSSAPAYGNFRPGVCLILPGPNPIYQEIGGRRYQLWGIIMSDVENFSKTYKNCPRGELRLVRR